MTEFPKLGSWSHHHEINPNDESIFNMTCQVCMCKYETTLKANSILEDGLIEECSRMLKYSLWRGRMLIEESYKVVRCLISICSNCGSKSEIGCIKTDKIVKEQVWMHGTY